MKMVLEVDGSSGNEQLEYYMAVELRSLFEIMKQKHHDYGEGNMSVFGGKGLVVRMFDKVQRLVRLVWHESQPLGESVTDSFRDIAGYAIIGILMSKDRWPRSVVEMPAKAGDLFIKNGRVEGVISADVP